jgi:hypothetical protein
MATTSFFGLPVLVERFPEARPVATAATLQHTKQQTEGPNFQAQWETRFPEQIKQPFVMAEALPSDSGFVLDDGHQFQAVEVGHSDTHDYTVLWVPEFCLAACGDVVYGQVHQMLFEANTTAKREDWIRAVEKVEALEPLYVVPGHCLQGEMHGKWHLENTKRYI